MKIETAKPFVRRGVTQLMYVGDDDAVEKATSSSKIAIGIAVVLGLWFLTKH